ncbi:MAG: type II toxin-antitoxin system RelE/ParE family toxin [Bacteroidales bacterium]|nr:type II toxin-antitoxin system RelE/ParE family toxin [Candidatus Minthousia equi]MDO4955772.1 type II toxin-antitoxin system RelE/ParE family toxin [Bacteroidales bacterium]
MIRRIKAYKNYYSDFMASLSDAERLKIQRALLLFTNNERIPVHFIKYIRDGVYEFRVTYLSNEFRIFFCYDGDDLVILFNGIRKKTQKLKNSDIEKAIKLKKEYYESKEG